MIKLIISKAVITVSRYLEMRPLYNGNLEKPTGNLFNEFPLDVWTAEGYRQSFEIETGSCYFQNTATESLIILKSEAFVLLAKPFPCKCSVHCGGATSYLVTLINLRGS